MKKKHLQKLIEPFIYNQLVNDEYRLTELRASDLLTWNRLDLAFKLFYLDNQINNPNLAKEIYKEDIKSQTLGTFVEYGNEVEKKSFEDYLRKFDQVFNNIKTNGFEKNKTVVPLCKNGKIINGSHRIASAIYLNKKVSCVVTNQKSMIADYKYFYDRNVSEEKLDTVVDKFIKYSNDNIYIAFLWPSGIGEKMRVESFFSNIIYKKEIKLSQNGAKNLLIELYKHMDWSGSLENNYIGINRKVFECFPTENPFTVLVFQSDSFERVIEVKKQVREVYNIGFSSIHITDTKEEAKRISKLIFNKNGIHFLNHSKPYTYKNIYKKLNEFQKYLNLNNISNQDLVLDGSIILSLYGIRKNEDIDFLLEDNEKLITNDYKYDTHDSELKYHKQNKKELIHNSKYYFEFNGFKFLSFQQLFYMKTNRNEKKDLKDCDLMNVFVDKSNFKKILIKQKQTFYYFKLRIKTKYSFIIGNFLRKVGLYKIVKYLIIKFK